VLTHDRSSHWEVLNDLIVSIYVMTLAPFSDRKRLLLNDSFMQLHSTFTISLHCTQILLHTIFGNHFLILNDLRINFPPRTFIIKIFYFKHLFIFLILLDSSG